ncbi:hypothetical protein BCR34DRAFT_6820 [Clohesyomyces aquaticus]|uniref:Uncharacterized protein n=1 Tax=Clohesyomyces aquaticus TaxID=1231657 RepID=A0A1Y2ABH3_9PLEO|nr:hypothetical protein BCR34DRAFT_6820 [Clohesyomyces aquaticus]
MDTPKAPTPVSETPVEAPSAAKSPCYRRAYYQKQSNKINSEQYFHYVFQHLCQTGARHKNDDSTHEDLEDLDPLGYSLNQWIVCMKPVENTQLFEDVFNAFLNSDGDIASVRRVQKKKDPQTWQVLQEQAKRTGREWAKHKRPRHGNPLEWDK